MNQSEKGGLHSVLDFTGKIALVTGGSRGIGKAIAMRLAEAGADLAINYLRDDDSAKSTAEAIATCGRRVELIRANVGDAEDLARLSETVAERFGMVDVVVSNAALAVFKKALDLRAKDWHWTMDIGALALLRLVQALAPLMRVQEASVVAISSLGAARAIPYYAAMGAAKAALESLARHLAAELAPRGIRVNVVSPGLVRTESLRYFPQADAMTDQAIRHTPLGRLVEPIDVADAVLFLASPLARMICGQTIIVDGGYSILA